MPDKPETLRQLLNEWDPIGVYDTAGDDLPAPPDEYDCLRAPVLDLLSQGADPDRLTEFLDRQLRDHFGLTAWPRPTGEFADRLVRWYRR